MDASVVVKVLWEEPGSDLAEGLFERGGSGLTAPKLLAYEVPNVIRHARAFSSKERHQLLGLFHGLRIPLHDLPDDAMGEVLALADEKDLTAYDAAYVVLARRLDTSLVTADTKLVRRMRDPRVVHLDEDRPEA